MLIGDFNQVENKKQKLGGSRMLKGAAQFLDWKLTNEMMDLPYHGVNYTWTNNRSNSKAIYERIDKAFCNTDWRDKYPDAIVWNLLILLSDHSPLVLQTQQPNKDKRRRPYCLDAWSLHHPEVCKIIKKEWEWVHEGSPFFVLQRKLQNSLRKIRSWCLRFKQVHNINWVDINNKLSDHQKEISSHHQAERDQESRNLVLSSLDVNTEYWRQRAKSRWDEFGDKSSAFFYKSVKGRSARNEIKAIKDDEGTWITNQSQIKSLFLESFKGIYQCGKSRGERIQYDDPFLSPVASLSQHHIDLLTVPFSNEEIKAACFSSKPLKSPGPDGTPPIFFQQNWDIVGSDVTSSVNSFFTSGYLLKEQNRSFITLIPKKDRP